LQEELKGKQQLRKKVEAIAEELKEGNRTSINTSFEEISQRLIENYTRPEKKAIYKQRAEKVELPFGHMRRTLAIRSFLLRGLSGVKAEMSLFSIK
jgi:hypothetical protein